MTAAMRAIDPVKLADGIEVSDLIAAAERLFDTAVLQVSCPGGRDRAIFRIFLKDQTVIASQRRYKKGAALEKRILTHIAPHTHHFPQLLGEAEGFLFQSDMGAQSLANSFSRLSEAQQRAIFAKTIASVFSYQRDIGRPVADAQIPLLFGEPEDQEYFLAGPFRTAELFGLEIKDFAPDSIAPEFAPSHAHFVKWDNRFANAALSEMGTIGWFDFEDSRLGAGHEDLAWLAADEFHSLSFAEIYPMFMNTFQAVHGQNTPRELRRFHLMTTLLIALRVRKIGRHLRRKGRWYSHEEIIKSDRVGAHPKMVDALLKRGQAFAALEEETRPLVRMFSQIHERLEMAREG